MRAPRGLSSAPFGWIVAGLVIATAVMPGVASAGVLPGRLTVTAPAGKTTIARFAVDSTPPIDVELVFDTTASLGGTLAEATDDAAGIVTDIQSHLPDARFAVAQFKDAGDKPEYRVEQALTASGTAVAAAVGRLSSKGGGDLPEAYNLAFSRSFVPATGGAVGWRVSSRKLVVVVGDAEPHGAGTAGIDGCEDTSADPHQLDTAAVLSSLSAAGRSLVMVHQIDHSSMLMEQMPASFGCYEGLARAAGGLAVEGDQRRLRDSIVTAVTSLVPAPGPGAALNLEVTKASPAWVALARTEASDQSAEPVEFTASIVPPTGTPPGAYRFELVALAGGVEVGHASLSVKVPDRKHRGHHHHQRLCSKSKHRRGACRRH